MYYIALDINKSSKKLQTEPLINIAYLSFSASSIKITLFYSTINYSNTSSGGLLL